MKWKRNFIAVTLCLVLGMIVALSACSKERKSPKVKKQKFPFYRGLEIKPLYSKSYVDKSHSSYKFEPVLQGDIVRHDFIIKNDSKAVLKISKVKGCCGCLVDSFSRSIQPGLTGKISALFLTDSRGGREIKGTIYAATNDENRPEITIDISLFVKEFANLSNYRIWLKGSYKQDIVGECIVVPNDDYPFTITGIKARKGVWFSYSYKEIQKNGKKGYEILVRNTRKTAGPYNDILFVQTDNRARPEFKIRIEGRITD